MGNRRIRKCHTLSPFGGALARERRAKTLEVSVRSVACCVTSRRRRREPGLHEDAADDDNERLPYATDRARSSSTNHPRVTAGDRRRRPSPWPADLCGVLCNLEVFRHGPISFIHSCKHYHFVNIWMWWFFNRSNFWTNLFLKTSNMSSTFKLFSRIVAELLAE